MNFAVQMMSAMTTQVRAVNHDKSHCPLEHLALSKTAVLKNLEKVAICIQIDEFCIQKDRYLFKMMDFV